MDIERLVSEERHRLPEERLDADEIAVVCTEN
jgi:hypothetical protein